MSLGTQIKAHRINAKLSQEKVADLVGVSRQAVTKWESGQSAPSTENLLKLAEIFGCSVEQMTQPAAAPGLTQSQVQELYHAFRAEEAREQADRRCSNRRSGLICTAAYFAWFLICKLMWAELGDQTVLSWLFGRHPLYHDYLFGWLLDKYLFCALVSIIPSFHGKRRFAAVTTAGFIIGMPLGEYLGALDTFTDPGYHYGWAIWGGIWVASIVLGIVLQRFPEHELDPKSKKLRIWCIAAAASVIGVIAFVLLNIPRHTWS